MVGAYAQQSETYQRVLPYFQAKPYLVLLVLLLLSQLTSSDDCGYKCGDRGGCQVGWKYRVRYCPGKLSKLKSGETLDWVQSVTNGLETFLN